MSAESAVLAGRALAEALMVDRCIITRRDGTTTTDPNTGVVTPNVVTVYPLPPFTDTFSDIFTDTFGTIHVGKCRVQNRAPRTQLPAAGETVWVEHLLELQIPMSVVGVRTGDIATMYVSALDPDLVGVRLRITVPVHKSHATARRMPCTEGGSDA